ncbi:hypothetical protein V1523DRAFT_132987 [Lipomyces doorenjongii]
MAKEHPELRWGIIATGMIASWFVTDLSIPRTDARAKHTVQAIGSSNLSKAKKFAQEFLPSSAETISCYGSYEEVYNDPNVDIIYIATPHAYHKQNCLDAIRAGKNVLCEKPFAVNAREAKAVIDAARNKGVYVMEGMWTRFVPLVRKLRELLYDQKVIGDINRTFADFGLDMPIKDLPATSRLRDVNLGAGSLLDIGIYSLTWGLLTLEDPGAKVELRIQASQTLEDGIDVLSSILLHYPKTGRHGILTSSLLHKTDDVFARVEGSKGTLLLSGDTASMPNVIALVLKSENDGKDMGDKRKEKSGEATTGQKQRFEFSEPTGGRGFYYEADAIALDIARGQKESDTMPLAETLRIMQILDEVRKQGGAKFPQDDE